MARASEPALRIYVRGPEVRSHVRTPAQHRELATAASDLYALRILFQISDSRAIAFDVVQFEQNEGVDDRAGARS